MIIADTNFSDIARAVITSLITCLRSYTARTFCRLLTGICQFQNPLFSRTLMLFEIIYYIFNDIITKFCCNLFLWSCTVIDFLVSDTSVLFCIMGHNLSSKLKWDFSILVLVFKFDYSTNSTEQLIHRLKNRLPCMIIGTIMSFMVARKHYIFAAFFRNSDKIYIFI